MRFSLVLFFVLALLCPSCITNIYLVRHAERLNSSSDSPLSTAGHQRAVQLKDLLLDKGIDLVYATPYLRTQQTGQPTADALGQNLIIYGTDTTYQFVQALKKMRGKDLLVVGHSNTVPEMVVYLTGDTVHIGHDDYDNLYKVFVHWSNVFN